jgi:glutaconate CoA-transferase subunit A
MIGAGCVETVIAAWVGNVMMGSAYNFRRAVEQDGMKVINMTNFTAALALQAGAMGIPFLPTRTALGSDTARNNEFFAPIDSPFSEQEPRGDGRPLKPALSGVEGSGPSEARQPVGVTSKKLHAVKALSPDVTIVHVQRADHDGNAHCWGNFGVMLEGVRAAKRVIVIAEEIVEPEIIASDPNRTVIPGLFMSTSR